MRGSLTSEGRVQGSWCERRQVDRKAKYYAQRMSRHGLVIGVDREVLVPVIRNGHDEAEVLKRPTARIWSSDTGGSL